MKKRLSFPSLYANRTAKKETGREIILKCVHKYPGISSLEIRKRTGLPVASISARLNEMVYDHQELRIGEGAFFDESKGQYYQKYYLRNPQDPLNVRGKNNFDKLFDALQDYSRGKSDSDLDKILTRFVKFYQK